MVAGPSLVRRVLPERAEFLVQFYWPTVIVLSICFLATLYHVSVPVRTNWSFNLPGATFALVSWILGSFLLRWVLTETAADSELDLRPARRADRRAAVALPAVAGRADRGRGQRRLRHGVPAEGDDAAPGSSSCNACGSG